MNLVVILHRVFTLVEHMNCYCFHWPLGAVAIGQDLRNNKQPKQGYQCVQVLRQSKIKWEHLFTISAKTILCMQ